MNLRFPNTLAAALVAVLLFNPARVLQAQGKPVEKEKEKEILVEDTIVLSPFTVDAGPGLSYGASSCMTGSRLGATVGGAKDARYFRDAVKRGDLPDPEFITAEGLFSEHDLPLRERTRGRGLFRLNAEAMPARLLTKPEIRYLAQVGLSSGLDAATWKREPLNLVAVVDKSGSMSGEPLELVKRSLHQVLAQLRADDQLSIVLYGDRAHVYLAPIRATRANHDRIEEAIDGIESAGSTNMEAGLKVGYEVARRTMREFHGRTRVMQFTDEQPNTGDTSAEGFMSLMKAASRDGIGQTTIGVGVEFDAKLATEISAVRGGNLFYFPNAEEMEKTFTTELDTMVSELAYDLELTVKPAPGLRLAEVYGIPSEMVEWSDDRTMRFHISTIFLSKRKGAIYLAFARADDAAVSDQPRLGTPVANVSLSYRERGDEAPRTAKLALALRPARDASPGLTRGRLLVNEFLGLRAAMNAHEESDAPKSYAVLKQLHAMFQADRDSSLNGERKLVGRLLKTMSGIVGKDVVTKYRAEDEETEEPEEEEEMTVGSYRGDLIELTP